MTEIRELVLAHRLELAQSLAARLQRRGCAEDAARRMADELVFLLESAVLQSAIAPSDAVEQLLAAAVDRAFPPTD